MHTLSKSKKSPVAVRPPGGYRSLGRSRNIRVPILQIFASKVCSGTPMDMVAGTASSRRG